MNGGRAGSGGVRVELLALFAGACEVGYSGAEGVAKWSSGVFFDFSEDGFAWNGF